MPATARWLFGLLIPLTLLSFDAGAQPSSSLDELGRFYMQNYAPEDYGGGTQNWAIVQAPEGLLYVGNNAGVLEFDGVSWRLIRISNRSVARSLGLDSEGRVHVGAVGELGYLAPDSLGRMRYVSLLEQLAPEDREFGAIWRIEKTSDGLYFRSNERLFRWDGRGMKVWRPETRFQQIFALRDTFYLQQKDLGLMRIERDDSLALAPGGVLFKDERIYGLVPWGEAGYLVIVKGGMFRCAARRRVVASHRGPADRVPTDRGPADRGPADRGPACAPFQPALNELLARLHPYHAALLPEGLLAIATIRGGVLLLDESGRLVRILNEATGLRNEIVGFNYVDRQGGLWLALNNGLARVEAGSSLSYYDKTLGLRGSAQEVARHQGRLYAATSLGVDRLEPAAAGAAPRFVPDPDVSQACWSLLSTPQGLLAGCTTGLYNLDTQELVFSSSEGTVFEVIRSRRDPQLLYLGLNDGLARMRLHAGRWTGAERVDGIRGDVRSMVEDARGHLWMGTVGSGVFRLEPAAGSDDPVIGRFGVDDGLPVGWIDVRSVAGRVVFLSQQGEGLFRIDSETGSRRAGELSFVPDTTFDAFLPQGPGSIGELTEDDRGRVWISAKADSGVARPSAGGGYTFAPTALRRVRNLATLRIVAEAGGPVWVGGSHGLIRLAGEDPPGGVPTESLRDPAPHYPVWIRRITSAGELLYDGQIEPRVEGGPTEPAAEGGVNAWPHEKGALRFAFAAPLRCPGTHPLPHPARGLRRRLVGLVRRDPEGLHQPVGRALRLSGAGARRARPGQSGARLRLSHPAAVVPRLVGLYPLRPGSRRGVHGLPAPPSPAARA